MKQFHCLHVSARHQTKVLWRNVWCSGCRVSRVQTFWHLLQHSALAKQPKLLNLPCIFSNKNTISKTSDSTHGFAWRKIIGTMFHLCPIIENVHKFHEKESISNGSLNHAQKLVIQHLYHHSTPNCWRPNGNNSSGINPRSLISAR